MLCFILAQVAQASPNPDPFGGWGTLLLQGGSFMLLSIILLVMVPREIVNQRMERERRDKDFLEMVKKLEEECSERTDKLAVAIEVQTKSLVDSLDRSTSKMAENVATAILKEKYLSSH